MNESTRAVVLSFYREPAAARMDGWQRAMLEDFFRGRSGVRMGTVRKVAAALMLYETDLPGETSGP